MNKNIDSEERNWLYSKLSKIPAAGIVFDLSAGMFFSFELTLVKILGDINPFELFTIRCGVLAVNCLAAILWNKQSFLVPKEEIKFLIPRCILGYVSVATLFFSLRMIALGDAVALSFTSPIFTLILVRIFLGEPFGLFQIFVIIASICGTILISRPTILFPSDNISSSDSQRLIESLLAICCAFTIASSFMVMRKLLRTPSSVATFWFAVSVVVFGMIYMGITRDFVVPKDSLSYILLLLIGIFATFAQLFLAMSLKLEQASVVAVAYTIDIVFAYIFQGSLINEKLNLLSLIGALIICLNIVVSAVRKLIVEKPLLLKKVSKSKINSYEV
ncbi:solute carrier family 35 member G1-like protein [Dinothrombium tinctorium]|uniref:Solute carrier family 35 member G1-like protein n=1 Tax=Dinothrombium tinctorium TaxID=1965070 RepID=A0A3S4QI33_9ACAR|nr:solute carrier family 35 member G1-like protein [Dinothrombium tinctorium]